MHWQIAFAAVVMLAGPVAAQESPLATVPEAMSPEATPAAVAPAAAPRPSYVVARVVMLTSKGAITIEVETQRAPVTAGNFLRYVDQKRFDGTTIYRAMKLGDDGQYGLIQGGVRGNPKLALPPVAHESTAKTGLTHDDGAISMARAAPGSAAGDFFITIGPLTALDADPAASGDNGGFAVFGHVTKGMEVVKAIQKLPTSATLGAGVMKGQMLAEPVTIVSVKRVK